MFAHVESTSDANSQSSTSSINNPEPSKPRSCTSASGSGYLTCFRLTEGCTSSLGAHLSILTLFRFSEISGRQAIAANAAALPEPIQKQFASLFDDAPQVPYSTIHRVFVNELGQPPSGPNGVFEVFEEKAVASASIAQVHKAKLWPTRDESGRVVDEGKWVAVKVQKPDVAKQMEWDIAAFRSVMWMFEHWAFDLPVYFVVDFLADHLSVVVPLPGTPSQRRLTELLSAQMFQFGQAHYDLHPGNILIRPSPTNRTQPQVLPEEFKREWAELWRAMLVGDFSGVKSVAERWGFGPLPDLVASFVMMRPTILRKGREVKKTDSGAEKTRKDGENEDRDNEKKRERMSEYELSLKMKQRLKEFLADTDRMPKVILFLNRNMRIMQGNNASFGSPVNGVKITGYWASKAPTRNTHLTFSERTREWYNHTRFQLSMFSMDFAIWKALVGFWLRTLPARMHARDALPRDDGRGTG
uniref:ABC1 atypical kinase-like domain-containing protein n=1 Tax=Psilocybe cubensis TaxID=181762 RepID=A0A8H7XXN5_PSICU